MSCEFLIGVRFHKQSLVLVNITPEGCRVRAQMAEGAHSLQSSGGRGICAGVVTAFAGFCLAQRYPITGSLIASAGVVGVLASREVYILGRNTSEVITANICTRAMYAISLHAFMRAMTRDMFFIGLPS